MILIKTDVEIRHSTSILLKLLSLSNIVFVFYIRRGGVGGQGRGEGPWEGQNQERWR